MYQHLEDQLTKAGADTDDILALTTTREGATNLRNYFSIAGKNEEIPCRDVHLARCLQFAMHKFRLSLFVKDLEPGGSTTFCFLIV